MTDPQPEYEFNTEQNRLIGELASKMRLVGQFFLVLGVLAALLGLAQLREGGVGTIVSGILYALLGNWTIRAAAAFRVIVDTEGSDIRLLMDALVNLRKIYSLMYWLIMIAITII